MKRDYLIIGQGLAGSILAYQLLQRGKTITIIDERKSSTSSKVAAGLVNPFTGPKMVKSWKAEYLFPFLRSFYSNLESEINLAFLTKKTIYRPFGSIEELNDWDGRSSQPNYQKFIKRICPKGTHNKYIFDEFGGIEIDGLVLNVAKFIDAMHNYLSNRCQYITSQFQESDLTLSDNNITYHEIHANKLVFCTGYEIQQSKYFGWVPMAPVKGELLYIKMDEEFETIYNKSCFIIPQGKGIYKAGSTYNREDLSEKPTDKGKNEITKKLNALLKMNYEIIRHDAGIRPGTVPRRPLMGFHPIHHQLGVFNGMGTKGVSLAPFFADQFVKCLEEGNNLDEEVDIKKYYSLYFNSHFSKEN